MKRVETILEDADYDAYATASAEDGRSMRLQTQFLICNFLKERAKKTKHNGRTNGLFEKRISEWRKKKCYES